MKTSTVPESRCPNCDRKSNRATGKDDTAPRPDDLTICCYCATALKFDQNLKLAVIETTELEQIKQNEPEDYAELIRFQQMIQKRLRAKGNEN